MNDALFETIDRLQMKLQAERADRIRKVKELAKSQDRIDTLVQELESALKAAQESEPKPLAAA